MFTKTLKFSCDVLLFITAIGFLVIANSLIIVTVIGQSSVLYGG